MSLLGVVSRWPVFAQATPSHGAWGFVVQEPSKRWSVSAEGGGGALAVSRAPRDWTIYAEGLPLAPAEMSAVTGELIIAGAAPRQGSIRVARSSSWFFIYEGTIVNVDALCAAIHPTWLVRGGHTQSATSLLFAHLMARLAEADSDSDAATDEAMRAAAADLHRAGSLGSAAFLCSNGARLYAYAAGHRLVVSSVADAILVGSPEVLPPRSTTRELSDGSMVSVAKLPQLGWSILAEP